MDHASEASGLIEGVNIKSTQEEGAKSLMVALETQTKRHGAQMQFVEINELADNTADRDQTEMDPGQAEGIRIVLRESKGLLPIFLIQSHGLYSTSLQLRKETVKPPTYGIRWARNGQDFIKEARNGQWIINTTPMDALGSCTQLENKFAKNIARDLGKYRNCILSSRVDEVFSLRTERGHEPIVNPQMFIPPTGLYADKEHLVWDWDKNWSWYMVVLPLFQPMNMEKVEAYFDFKLVAGKPDDVVGLNDEKGMQRRLVNRRILDDDSFWVKGQENVFWPEELPEVDGQVPSRWFIRQLRKRYAVLTRMWEDALPRWTAHGRMHDSGPGAGKVVLMSKMMEALGDGIFISMTCSPMVINNRWEGNLYQEQQLTLQSISAYLNQIIKASNERWRYIFRIGRSDGDGSPEYATRGCHPLELETASDFKDSLGWKGPLTRRGQKRMKKIPEGGRKKTRKRHKTKGTKRHSPTRSRSNKTRRKSAHRRKLRTARKRRNLT